MIKKWIYLLLGVTFLSTIQGNYNLNIGGPVIIPTEEEIVLQTGQNFTILCKSHRPLQFKKEELSEDSTFSDFHLSETTIISENSSHTYTIKLELTNIDEFAVGYYACFDNTVDPDNVLVDVLQEPTNTPHISYIYVYVNGTEKVVVPMSDILKVENDIDEIVIKCRPTLPDVNMTLVVEPMSNKENIQEYAKFHPKLGFTVKTAILKDRYTKCTCKAKMGIRNDTKHIRIYSSKPQKPKLEVKNDNFLSGETFTILCYINSSTYNIDGPIDLTWKWPNTNRKPDTSKTNLHNTKGSNIIYRNITITNASKEDEGSYYCNVTNGGSKDIKMNYREPGFLQLAPVNKESFFERKVSKLPNNCAFFNLELQYANPQPEINYYFNGKKLTIDENTYKYKTERKWKPPYFWLTLTIKNVTMDDSGEYKCVASNGYKNKTVSTKLNFIDGPFITFDTNDKELVDGQRVTLRCSVKSNPMREVKWYLDDKPTNGTKHSTKDHINESMLEIELHKNTIITCESGGQSKRKKIIVYELNNSGFGIKEKKSDEPFWISQNENAVITCIASNNKYSNCTWLDSAGNSLDSIVTYSNETLSYKAKLEIKNIKLSQAGNYTCVGIDKAGNFLKFENIYVQVAETKALAVIFPKEDQNKAISPFNNKIEFKCEADGIPPPRVQWKKDGIILSPANTINITTTVIAHSTVKSTVLIKQVLNSTSGKYECIFKNNNNTMSRSYTVKFIKEGTTPLGETGLAILASVLIALVLLVVYLTWRMWKDKKQLRKMGMGYFKQGRKLNPNLGLDEQADMLPYDERFEFPRKKLSLGELLGSGAFGAVYKAEARGIINAERTDIVAVKMVKKDADLSHIVALASELKIMIHLGKHVNIVNLLGACTKNLVKSELLVIVEYCEFGNLHNYVRRHREVFIDQLTDNSTKYGKVNRGYSCSNNSNTGTHVDYSSDANLTQNTDHTFLNTGQSNRSTRRENKTNQVIKGVEDASERSMDKRSESNEYSDGRQLRPLSSRDLLAWSFQIARGMDYLAKRKVFHGDLAARNILLANDNVVKICDFGLARSMYKNEEYLKQENSLLPVKWLAIECMTERAFSTQSDIWAYGIVLWELFSLAMSPYPNVSHSDLLEWLQQGNRLEKPAHADDRLYEVMLRCWHHKPQARPNFSVLEETLGSFLDENDRNHYVDLNQEYINYNLNHGGEDYLAMIAAPEYNIATPNINDYVNVDNERRFFPRTPLPEDDQGYLQVTPKCGVTPRDHNKFEFKTRRSETESHELTPMLSTNNLPSRSISESDQEGNISPYPKMCPRIDEEDNDIDDVFENNQHNIKNTVTNPTYITITADIEKKPVYEKKEFLNNYVNVSNGLVK